MTREFASPVRFAQVATLPPAASSPGVVLEQGARLWFSNGTAWIDLGAAGNPRWIIFDSDATLIPGMSYLSTSDFVAIASLMNFNGANGSQTFFDAAGPAWSVLRGSPMISTAQSRFGGASLEVNGNVQNSCIVAANASGFFFPGDFSIEFWIRIESTAPSNRAIFATCADALNAGGLAVYFAGGAAINVFDYVTNTNIFASSSALPIGVWTHVAISRHSVTVRLFQNGVVAQTAIRATSFTAQAGQVAIGSWASGAGSSASIHAFLDDFRITPNALFVENFTPPVAELSAAAQLPNVTLPSLIQSGDAFTVSGASRIIPGSGRQIGSAGLGTSVTTGRGQTLRIVARNNTQLDIV